MASAGAGAGAAFGSGAAESLLPAPSARAVELLEILRGFVRDDCLPAEGTFKRQMAELAAKHGSPWEEVPPIVDELKAKAKALGLWNLFLPKEYPEGPGLTNLEYAPMCEVMGTTALAAEACNCSAPDTGNMEVLARYGTPAQKKQWLEPLMDGRIRSVFFMTEPEVASSDATNIESSIKRVGDSYVLNGRKWWSSGAMDPRCKIGIFMGKTDTTAPVHQQQSMILVPLDTPGVKIIRPLHVFGYTDAPHGHAEVAFENVRVPVSNMLLGEGRGFEIAQGRLGPGRIHHCMRTIGVAERALDALIRRAASRTAFKMRLLKHETVQRDIAESRMAIETARLLVLRAAALIDSSGAKGARKEIAMIKVYAPRVALDVIDRAIQVHGGMGVCQDTFLAYAWAGLRTLRIADGPDEVHLRTVGGLETRDALKRHGVARL